MDRFRKYKDKLASLEDSQDRQRDGEGDEDTQLEWTKEEENAILSRPSYLEHKRASEPTLSYNSPQPLPGYVREPQARPIFRSVGYESSACSSPAVGDISSTGSPSPNPLGLKSVYAFEVPEVDLVFVHGLGGTSVRTWSWGHNTVNFWPPWLSSDSELRKSRIFTFGYDATMGGKYTSSNILDFAKDLLFQLKTYVPEHGVGGGDIGTLPIIFIMHSMGGLVVKKAYIIGKADNQYSHIIERVSAMIFLATPHRGSSLAQTCNNILKATPGHSIKQYVLELEKGSNTLQDINEQFRSVCGGLDLVSFYETLKTNLGVGFKKMIVDRDSALLEYPGETSSSLQADHHGMSKFKNQMDPNYISVKNALKWLVRKLMNNDGSQLQVLTLPEISRRASQSEGSDWYRSRVMSLKAKLMEILGVPETGESDLDFFTSRTMEGSCEWILSRQYFQNWLNDNSEASSTVWLTGNPGSGKSMLASFAISQLTRRFSAGSCQYHFFVAAHRSKRTVSYLLRSLALQTALSRQDFCSLLLDLHENTGIIFRDQKATIVWEKLFEGILFLLNLPTPIFWVFDGLDEAESPSGLIRLLSKMHLSPRINVLLISRATKELSKDISEYLPTATRDIIAVTDTEGDIRKYVSSLVHRSVPGDYAQNVTDDILAKASGSFLWVKLALERIRDNWYTRDDIKAALSEIPEGMEPLYERMIEAIARHPPKPRKIASRILNWTACAFKPLKISELEEALKPEFQGFVHLEQTIEEVCGNFVLVNRSMVTPIHQTARQFLLRKVSNPDLAIGEHEGNAHAAMVCIKFISDSMTWPKIFSNVQTQHQGKPVVGAAVFEDYPFLFYSLSFWAYHVSLAPPHADYLLEAVLRFLETHCLLWINGVALTKNLRILTQAAQHLKIYARRINSKRSNHPQTSLTLARDGELKQWANDLIHLVGRFGTNLVESPLSIYKYVVPFCPKDSIISTSFRHTSGSTFAVSGISSTSWSDCLARITTGEDQSALKLLCKDTFFVTLVGIDGELIVWLAETCEEVRRFAHGEYVMQMASSKTSNLIATASAKSTKIWDITTGEELYNIPNERHHHTKAMAFGRDNTICLAYDDCVIRCVDMKSGKEKWQCVAKEPGVDTHNCARYMSFSPDLTQIAIVFRGRPVVVWALQALAEARFIPPKRCILLEDKVRLATDGDAWNAPEVALWHPITDHLIILYEDTKIVDWNVAEDEQTQHSHLGARAMVLSPDGNLLLTSDVHGTLSLWMVPEYRLTYKLQYEELVMDLAFSPDGTRFYDIRGTFCNVWEPDALFRPDRDQNQDEDENSSAYLTTSEPVISTDTKPRLEITSLVSDSSGKFYCCGTEDGTVTMYAIPEGTKVKKIISHDSSVSVIKLAWSSSQRYLASADDSGRVILKRLGPPTSGSRRWAVFPGFDIRVGEAVEHLIFSAREDFLLISCPTTTRVMSLKTKREHCRALLPSGAGAVYLNHPSKPSILVHVDTERERQYLWSTLAQQESSPNIGTNFLPHSSPGATPGHTNLRRISQAVQCRTHWLVQETLLATGYSHRDSDNRYIELIDLSQLGKRVSAGQTPKGQRIEGLAKHVRRLIGCLHNRLVFVDRGFWLCTWEIESIYRRHKRHFFLPKDWLSPTALSLIVLTTQGTLLCPRNGEVGVVQSGFKS